MRIFLVVAFLLLEVVVGVACTGVDKPRRTLCSTSPELCEVLNVTITPVPVATALEGGNVTLYCQVWAQQSASSRLVVRWLFVPPGTTEEQLVVRLNMRRAKFYGNYTKSFPWPKMQLLERKLSQSYGLLILNVSREDHGSYICRVQEIRKLKDRWRAASNGTAATELRVHLSVDSSVDGIWQLFADVYLCAVLICSVGLVCMCLFTVVITCQCLRKKRTSRANYYLVKCPQNSSGETVTSIVSLSPVLSKKDKRRLKKKVLQEPDIPPAIPAKDRLRRPKLIKTQSRKVVLPKIADDRVCMYAELELAKPLPETKSSCTGTVYAQILFEERPL